VSTLTLKKPSATNYLSSFAAVKQCLPLVKGIHKALLDGAPEGVSNTAIRKAIKAHAFSEPYLKALSKEGAMRHNLKGKPVEAVTESAREAAIKRLEAL